MATNKADQGDMQPDVPAPGTEAQHLAWPLTGRETELDLLIRAVATSSATLVGPAGVGKTRLLDELRAQMAATGRPVLRMTATHTSSAIPLGAVAPLLDGDRVNVQQTLVGARRIADRLSGQLVMIDDAHLLDHASATLVHHLTMLGTTIVSTIRSDAHAHAPDAVVAPSRDGHAARIDLRPLSPQDVRSLLCTVLGADVDDASLHQLYELSAGNLVHLHELIRGALDSGAITRERDVWRLHAPPGANPGLTQLLRLRLAKLTEHERELLDLMAIAEPMSLTTAEQVVGDDGLTTLESMELVRFDRHGRRHEVRLSHPLYGEAIRDGLSTIRQVALHRVAAEHLEATPMKRRDDPIRVAVHRLEGGGAVDASVVTSAAEHAIVTGDLELGIRLARVAIMSGDRIRGGLLLAEALSELGRDLEAVPAVEESWDLATDEMDIVLIAIRKAVITLRTTGDVDKSLAVLDAATARMSDAQCLAELEAHRAVFSLLRGDLDAAVRHGLRVVDSTTGRPLLSAAVGCVPRWRCRDVRDRASPQHLDADGGEPPPANLRETGGAWSGSTGHRSPHRRLRRLIEA